MSVEYRGEKFAGHNKSKPVINPGDIINGFVVLRSELIGKNKTWVCKCKCGSEKRFWKLSAISRQKTCGCGTDEAGLTAKQRRSMLSRMNGYKSGARSRGFSWDLSYLDFVKTVTKNCFYCNSKPKIWDCVSGAPSVQKDNPHINPKDYKIKFTGLDRLNSDLGYAVKNVVPCCVKCNRSKNDMSLSEFKDHVERMYVWLFQKQ